MMRRKFLTPGWRGQKWSRLEAGPKKQDIYFSSAAVILHITVSGLGQTVEMSLRLSVKSVSLLCHLLLFLFVAYFAGILIVELFLFKDFLLSSSMCISDFIRTEYHPNLFSTLISAYTLTLLPILKQYIFQSLIQNYKLKVGVA